MRGRWTDTRRADVAAALVSAVGYLQGRGDTAVWGMASSLASFSRQDPQRPHAGLGGQLRPDAGPGAL